MHHWWSNPAVWVALLSVIAAILAVVSRFTVRYTERILFPRLATGLLCIVLLIVGFAYVSDGWRAPVILIGFVFALCGPHFVQHHRVVSQNVQPEEREDGTFDYKNVPAQG